MTESTQVNDGANLVEVPWESISTQALNGLIEEFISRDGTDYGLSELRLEQKVSRAKKALAQRSVLIIVDVSAETTQIVSADEYQQMLKQLNEHD